MVFPGMRNSGFLSLIMFFFFFLIFIFERERDRQRQSASGGGAERETQNLKQALGSELSAQSLMWGSNSRMNREIMT